MMNTLRNFMVIFLLGAAIFLAGVLLGKTLSDLNHERQIAKINKPTLSGQTPVTTVVQVQDLPKKPSEDQEKSLTEPLPSTIRPLTPGAEKIEAEQTLKTSQSDQNDEKVKLTFYDTLTADSKPAITRKRKKTTEKRQLSREKMPKKEKVAALSPAVAGGLNLQVGSFPQEGQARLFRNRLAKKGYGKIVVVPATIPGKGTWYRVRIVGLATRHEVDLLSQRLWRQEKIKAFLVK